jgi:hypothetical protein
MMLVTRFLVLYTPASGRARNRLCAIQVGAPRHSMLTCMLLLLQLSGAVGQLCTILLIEATATAATDADAERAASAANGLSERGRRVSSSMATIRTLRMPTLRTATLRTATLRTATLRSHCPHSHSPSSCNNNVNSGYLYSDGTCVPCTYFATNSSLCSVNALAQTNCRASCGLCPSPPPPPPHTHTPHSHSPHSHHPPPSPSTQTSSLKRWTVLSGGSHCEVTSDGRCITDGIGNYGNYEYCTFRAEVSMTVTTTVFGTESGYDFITIGGTRYSGSTGPMNVQVAAGSTVTWNSDGSVTGTGFQICTDTPLSPDGCACIDSSMGCTSASGIYVYPRCGCHVFARVDRTCYVYGGSLGCPSATISNWIDGLAYIPCKPLHVELLDEPLHGEDDVRLAWHPREDVVVVGRRRTPPAPDEVAAPTVETGMPIIGVIACVIIALVLAMVFMRWFAVVYMRWYKRWPQVTVVDTPGIQMYKSPCACADDGC